jgi:hypothetical protein
MLGGVAMAICGSYHGIRAAYCRRTDTPFRWIVALNRFSAVLFTANSTMSVFTIAAKLSKYQIWAVGCWAIGAVLVLILLLTRN